MAGATLYDRCWKCHGRGAVGPPYTVPLRGEERCENCGAPRHENVEQAPPMPRLGGAMTQPDHSESGLTRLLGAASEVLAAADNTYASNWRGWPSSAAGL